MQLVIVSSIPLNLSCHVSPFLDLVIFGTCSVSLLVSRVRIWLTVPSSQQMKIKVLIPS